MSKVVITLEEHLATLKKSSMPTIITEGSDDYLFFRHLEERLKNYGVSLHPVNGRKMLLEIFERRKELGRNNVAFIADKDLWVFEETPREYKHRKLMFTDGYSIENDLFRDGDFLSLLGTTEKQQFDRELRALVAWYSYCVEENLAGREVPFSHHPNQVLDVTGNICPMFSIKAGYTKTPIARFHQVFKEFEKLLRGKTLMALLMRQLNDQNRSIKHGRKQLLEIASARQGFFYTRLLNQAEAFFQSQ